MPWDVAGVIAQCRMQSKMRYPVMPRFSHKAAIMAAPSIHISTRRLMLRHSVLVIIARVTAILSIDPTEMAYNSTGAMCTPGGSQPNECVKTGGIYPHMCDIMIAENM